MPNVTLEIPPATIIITGMNFMQYAVRYRDAAVQAAQQPKKQQGFDPVPYQLYCQSLELHLKSYIWLVDGIGRKTIRNKYGHDLLKLWQHSLDRGLGRYAAPTENRNNMISLVSPYYKNRKFCYLDIDMIFEGYRDLKKQPNLVVTISKLTLQLQRSLRAPLIAASQSQ